MKTFPSPEALRRFPFGLADIAVILGTLVLLALIARLGAGTLVSFYPPDIVPGVELDPRRLPYYAGRSTLRMFIRFQIKQLSQGRIYSRLSKLTRI
jgi:NitT/TauT family transport system permease protein